MICDVDGCAGSLVVILFAFLLGCIENSLATSIMISLVYSSEKTVTVNNKVRIKVM
jgi:hypothetical protein